MELDSSTGKFKKFSFSFKHPVTWWFLLGFFTQILTITLDIQVVKKLFIQDGSVIKLSIPPVIASYFLVEHFSILFLSVFVRYFVLKYSNIQRAIHTLWQVHKELRVDDFPAEQIPDVKTRTILGLIFVIISVSTVLAEINKKSNHNQSFLMLL